MLASVIVEVIKQIQKIHLAFAVVPECCVWSIATYAASYDLAMLPSNAVQIITSNVDVHLLMLLRLTCKCVDHIDWRSYTFAMI